MSMGVNSFVIDCFQSGGIKMGISELAEEKNSTYPHPIGSPGLNIEATDLQ